MNEMLDKLGEAIRPLGSVAIGFSGGVDSSVVCAAAVRVLGPEKVLAVTADSESMARRELENARRIARELGILHAIIHTNELECDGYRDNSPERCFYCKDELWRRVRAQADDRGLKNIADGVNADDLGDYRPGIRASDEAGVVHPLVTAGMGKKAVRTVARAMGLSNWDKPAQACLSSRFPYGQRLTPEGLKRVEEAEEFLRNMGLPKVRVRSHGDIARIEVPAGQIRELMADDQGREAITTRLKQLGFSYVTLDLEGFRSGSMNEALPDE